MLARVADNLYWMSRYLERTEHTARLLDVHLNLLPDQSPAAARARQERMLTSLQASYPENKIENERDSHYQLLEFVLFDTNNENSVVNCVQIARDNARQVREQISSEMWEQVNQLYFSVQNAHMNTAQVNTLKMNTGWREQPSTFLQAIRRGTHLFQGLTDSTMSHGEGWQFIELGRYIERAIATTRFLEVEYAALEAETGQTMASDTYLNCIGLLKGCTAFEAYSKVYTADIQPRKIVEFLLLNRDFPHSICFCADGLQKALDAIAELTNTYRGTRVYRLSGRLRAAMDYGQVDEILHTGIDTSLGDVRSQCGQIHEALYQLYISYPIEEKLVL